MRSGGGDRGGHQGGGGGGRRGPSHPQSSQATTATSTTTTTTAATNTATTTAAGTTPTTATGVPKKESILELQKLMDSTVRVKCIGGRELEGTLRGYDDLVNLVLHDCDEFIRDPVTQQATDIKRRLGLVVVRGTQVSLVSPQDGVEEIANPFIVAHDDDDDNDNDVKEE